MQITRMATWAPVMPVSVRVGAIIAVFGGMVGGFWGRRSGDGFNCLCQLGNVFIFVWIFNVCRMRLLVWRVVTYSTFNPSSVERCQSGGATAIDPSF